MHFQTMNFLALFKSWCCELVWFVMLQIHTGSPWIQSRPVFVLIQQQPGTDVPLTYTLKTKVSWAAAEDELSKVSCQALGTRCLACAALGAAGCALFPDTSLKQ